MEGRLKEIVQAILRIPIIAQIREKDVLFYISHKMTFTFIIGTYLYFKHMELSEGFLVQDIFYFDAFQNVYEILKEPNKVTVFKEIYKYISWMGIYCSCFYLYSICFGRFIEGKSLPKEENEVIESVIPEFPYDYETFQLIIGLLHNKFNTEHVTFPKLLILPALALFQNMLIIGTIGMGKTASCMYPFTKQLLAYQHYNPEKKAGGLILDVKGNYYKKVVAYAEEFGRQDDVIVIELDGNFPYNPLNKPDMEPIDLASRSRTVLDLFSGGAKKEKFWDTKAAQMMTECIRLMRLTTGYVTLADIHNLVSDDNFLTSKMEILFNMIEACEEAGNEPSFDMKACRTYFMGEFSGKAETTISTIKSCVTEMTSFFASSERVNRTFCPSQSELAFTGFEQCINEGKIVILAINKAQYPEVAKTIAAYLKLDFQSEVMQRTSNPKLNSERPVFFICDEYQEFVTANDADFYGLSRESNCCSIVSSQSYSSILKTLGNKEAFDVLQQNLINKIWLRTDDKLTIDTAQMLTGKEEKEKYSKNISESINDAKKSKIFGRLASDKASLSESLNVSTQRDFVFAENVFTQTLTKFKAVHFTANEDGMNEPYIVHLFKYFEPPITEIKSKALQDKSGRGVINLKTLKNETTKKQEKETIEKEIQDGVINLKALRERKMNENED